MPKDTFIKLSEDKKQKILEAAKKEFARVPFSETSIKNIVENANIARGSFYQYFESKEDLLICLLSNYFESISKIIEKATNNEKNDIFEMFVKIYDGIIEVCNSKEESDLYKRLLEDVKSSEDNILLYKLKDFKYGHNDLIYINDKTKEKLKIDNDNDIKIIYDMLFIITRRAIVKNFKYQNKEELRKMYLKEIEYLKYGILK